MVVGFHMSLLAFNVPLDPNFVYPLGDFSPKTIFHDNSNGLSIRTMSLPELVATRENWLVPEGWSGIKNVLSATYANDPEGFYLLEKDGDKIASISVVTYPEINFAYIGFYLVIRPMRGQGYGKFLISKTMEYTAANRGVTAFGLNCVEVAVPMYQKYGFQVVTTDKFWKFTKSDSSLKYSIGGNILKINTLDSELLADLIKYDASILKAHRKEFLPNFLFKPGTMTIISQSNGVIDGYGVISVRDPVTPEPFTSYKIGPLYADNADIAYAVLWQLLSILNVNESVYLETPGNNNAAAELVQSLGFIETGFQPKMFKGQVPEFDVARMFCYSSIAIGG